MWGKIRFLWERQAVIKHIALDIPPARLPLQQSNQLSPWFFFYGLYCQLDPLMCHTLTIPLSPQTATSSGFHLIRKRKKRLKSFQSAAFTSVWRYTLCCTQRRSAHINYRWMLWLMTLFDLCICVLLSPNTLCLWVQYTNDVYLTLSWHKQALGLGRAGFTNKNNK